MVGEQPLFSEQVFQIVALFPVPEVVTHLAETVGHCLFDQFRLLSVKLGTLEPVAGQVGNRLKQFCICVCFCLLHRLKAFVEPCFRGVVLGEFRQKSLIQSVVNDVVMEPYREIGEAAFRRNCGIVLPELL